MTAKQFVLERYPDAFPIKVWISNFLFIKLYEWVIYINMPPNYLAKGKTERKAWEAAKQQIIEQDKKKTDGKF